MNRPTLLRSLLSAFRWSLLSAFVLFVTITQPPIAEADPPLGLRKVKHPKDNPPSAGKVELGKMLYFDPRLSSDNTISCASCHNPEKGFSNGEQFATGVDNQQGGRNSPTIINTAYQRFQFWDGRARSLEDQALGPIANPIEMNLPIEDAVKKINAIPGYRKLFQQEFDSEVTAETLAQAIAAFERTILSGDAPYDRYEAGDASALSPAAIRGKELFFGKANCSACHTGPNFTDNAFHNIGIGMDAKVPDPGRFAISQLGGDMGSFKTPTLREIAQTAPYMHDGSLTTLEQVVQHYNKGGIPNEFLDEEIFKMNLTDEEIQDLVIFMTEGLSSDSYPNIEPPNLPQ